MTVQDTRRAVFDLKRSIFDEVLSKADKLLSNKDVVKIQPFQYAKYLQWNHPVDTLVKTGEHSFKFRYSGCRNPDQQPEYDLDSQIDLESMMMLLGSLEFALKNTQ